MPTIGPLELVIVLVVVLVIFGPGRLPEIGSALGRSIGDFRRALQPEPHQEKLKQEGTHE
jgi:sec-independent protein translocase protein TatA